MPMTYELKVINNKLPAAHEFIQQLAHQVVYKTAYDIEAFAKAIAPVDTGFLKNSIQVVAINDLNAIVSVGAEYGINVELGTRFQRAQPFMMPAVTAAKPSFESAMAEVLNPDNWI